MPALTAILLLLGAATDPLPAPSATQNDAEIAAAARDYRIVVYQTFRLERTQYDLRRAAGDDLLSAWEKSLGGEEHRSAVLDWYAEATRAAESGGAAPAPPELPLSREPIGDLTSGPGRAPARADSDGHLPPPAESARYTFGEVGAAIGAGAEDGEQEESGVFDALGDSLFGVFGPPAETPAPVKETPQPTPAAR